MLIESSISFPEQSWEAVLWHNCHEHGEWHETHLEEVHAAAHPVGVAYKYKLCLCHYLQLHLALHQLYWEIKHLSTIFQRCNLKAQQEIAVYQIHFEISTFH